MTSVPQVDQTALKTGQLTTILLLVAAFVLGEAAWPLVLFVAVAQFLGALAVPFAPYRLLYLGLRRVGLKPNLQPDNPEPHRFSLLVGTLFNGAGALALALNAVALGWSLVWIVIALANLNFWGNFCVGCWVYYQLNRLGVPGFSVAPLRES